MIVQEGLAALAACPAGATMSIGNFDGVHIGHRTILSTARADAEGELVAVTFEPHPLTVLRPALAPPRITPLDLKHQLLADLGVDRLIILPPAEDVLGLSAEDFFAILRDRAKVRRLVEGPDFNFGKARSGNVERLKEWCDRDGIALHLGEDVMVTLEDRLTAPVSSSLIRWLLAYGRAGDAMRCLGRPYRLIGTVVGGERRGRTIGFPTANLDCGDALLPADGVYAATTTVDGTTHGVALSIGTKPTFHTAPVVTVEGYLLDFAGDLYGRQIAFDLVAWLRGQQKYPTLETLIADLNRDVANVRDLTALSS